MPKPRRLWIDLETYSRKDLKKVTPYSYAADEEFQILLGSYATNLEPEVRDVEGQTELLDEIGDWLVDPEVVKVAHNAAFERVCLSAALGLPVGEYLAPEHFHDTQAVAGCYGYPQKLADLAPALGAAKKDEAGTHLINYFCKPDKHGRRRLPEDHPEKWAAFVAYCHQDVVTLKEVDELLGDFPTLRERLIYWADQRVNDHGLLIDTEMAERAVAAAQANATEYEAELREITGLEKPNNPVTLRAWFEETARVRMPDMTADTVSDALERLAAKGETTSSRYRALELRSELALTASKKFVAALDAVNHDNRLRGSFRYFGAHTGRWAGRGAQPQNLPRHSFDNEVDTELAIAELKAGERVSPDELKKLVRPLFTGDPALTVVDYSAIEARVIAWLAGEEWALEAFRNGRDIYVETAERMGGLSRSQGKIAVLALGYAGGIGSLRAMGYGGKPGDDDYRPDPELQMMVEQWRRANRNIVRFWHRLEDAFGAGSGQAGRIEVDSFENSLGRTVRLHLPSGRAIHYHGTKWERFPVKDAKTGRMKWKEGWRYANPKDPFNWKMRISTYGGRLSENVTQAVARDVLAEALVRLVRHGYRPLGHVHDEILVEGDDLPGVTRLMTTRPKWAAGLPVDAEGFVCTRYRKG